MNGAPLQYWYRVHESCGGGSMVDCIRGDYALVADLRQDIFRRLKEHFPGGIETMCITLANGQVLDPHESPDSGIPSVYKVYPSTLGAKQLLVTRIDAGKLDGLIFSRAGPAANTTTDALTFGKASVGTWMQGEGARAAAATLRADERRRPWSAGATPLRRALDFVSPQPVSPPPPRALQLVLEVYLDAPAPWEGGSNAAARSRHRRSPQKATVGDADEPAGRLLSTAPLYDTPTTSADAALEHVKMQARETAALALQTAPSELTVVRLYYHDAGFDEMLLLTTGQPLLPTAASRAQRAGPCRIRAFVGRPSMAGNVPPRKPIAPAEPEDEQLSDLHSSDSDIDSAELNDEDLDKPTKPRREASPRKGGRVSPSPVAVEPRAPEPPPPKEPKALSPSAPPPPSQQKASSAAVNPNPRMASMQLRSASREGVAAVVTPLQCPDCPIRAAELFRVSEELNHTRQAMMLDLDRSRADLENVRNDKAHLDAELEKMVAALIEERRKSATLDERLAALTKDVTRREERARLEGAAEAKDAAARWKEACEYYRTEAEKAVKEADHAKSRAEEMIDAATHENVELTEALLQERRKGASSERRLDELLTELRALKTAAALGQSELESRNKEHADELKRVKKKALALKKRLEDAEALLAIATADRETALHAATAPLEVKLAHLDTELEVMRTSVREATDRADKERLSCVEIGIECRRLQDMLEKATKPPAPKPPAFDASTNTNGVATRISAVQTLTVVVDARPSLMADEHSARQDVLLCQASEWCEMLQEALRCSAAIPPRRVATPPPASPPLVDGTGLTQINTTAAPSPMLPRPSMRNGIDDSSFNFDASAIRRDRVVMAALAEAEQDAASNASTVSIPDDLPQSPSKSNATRQQLGKAGAGPPPDIVIVGASSVAVAPAAASAMLRVPAPEDVVEVSDVGSSSSSSMTAVELAAALGDGAAVSVTPQSNAAPGEDETPPDQASEFVVDPAPPPIAPVAAAAPIRRASPAPLVIDESVPLLPCPSWKDAIEAAAGVLRDGNEGAQQLDASPSPRKPSEDGADSQSSNTSFGSLEDDLDEYTAVTPAAGGVESTKGKLTIDKAAAARIESSEVALRRDLVKEQASTWEQLTVLVLATRIVDSSYRKAIQDLQENATARYDDLLVEQNTAWKGLIAAFGALRLSSTNSDPTTTVAPQDADDLVADGSGSRSASVPSPFSTSSARRLQVGPAVAREVASAFTVAALRNGMLQYAADAHLAPAPLISGLAVAPE